MEAHSAQYLAEYLTEAPRSFSRTAFGIAIIAAAALSLGSAAASAPPRPAPLSLPTLSATGGDISALSGTARPMKALAAGTGSQSEPETVYRALTPCRIVNTSVHGGALAANSVRSFVVGGTSGFAPQGGLAGGCGVPLGATAVTVTMAVANPSGAGYLKAWPAGYPEPKAAALNYFRAAGNVSTGSTLSVRPLFQPGLQVRNHGPAVNLVIDVQGYFIPQIQALIGSDGTTLGGNTSRIVGTSHSAPGIYAITLDRPVRQCAPSANTYNIFRYASVGLSSETTPNTISVYVWDLNNSTHVEELTNYSFFLTVTC